MKAIMWICGVLAAGMVFMGTIGSMGRYDNTWMCLASILPGLVFMLLAVREGRLSREKKEAARTAAIIEAMKKEQ